MQFIYFRIMGWQPDGPEVVTGVILELTWGCFKTPDQILNFKYLGTFL